MCLIGFFMAFLETAKLIKLVCLLTNELDSKGILHIKMICGLTIVVYICVNLHYL